MPYDLIVFFVILTVSFFAVIYFGKSSSVSIIFSFFTARLITIDNPYKELILSYGRTPVEDILISVLLFVLVFLISYIIIRKAVSVVFPWTPITKALEIAVLAIIISGLAISTIVNLVPVSSYITNQIAVAIFQNPNSIFYWFAGSLPVLSFILRR